MPSLVMTIAVDRMKLDVEGHLLYSWRQYNNLLLPMNAEPLDEMIWRYVETIGVDKHYDNGEQVKVTREKYTLDLTELDEVAMIGDLFQLKVL